VLAPDLEPRSSPPSNLKPLRLLVSPDPQSFLQKSSGTDFEFLQRRVPVILQAEFFDESSTNFEVDTATTASDSIKLLLEAKQVKVIDGYSLWASVNGKG